MIRFKYYTITQFEQEANYLREMHRKGWKFVKVNGIGLYHFEPCTPEDVVYQLDYNQEGIEHKDEYVQLFNDCGWEYLQDYVGYSYFRKPASQMDGEEEIFCDDQSRLDMLNRIFKGRIVTMIIIFLTCIVGQILLNMHRPRVVLVFGTLGIVYIILFAQFAISYYGYKKKVSDN